MEPRLYRGIY